MYTVFTELRYKVNKFFLLKQRISLNQKKYKGKFEMTLSVVNFIAEMCLYYHKMVVVFRSTKNGLKREPEIYLFLLQKVF